MASALVRFTLTDGEDRSVEIEARYYPKTEAYFDRGWGNYLPGDPEDVEVLSVKPLEPGADCAEIEADEERIYEGARMAAGDEREGE